MTKLIILWGVTKNRTWTCTTLTERTRKEMFKWTEFVLSEWVVVV